MTRSVVLLASTILLPAGGSAKVRTPLGVYAKVNIEDAISGYPGNSPSASKLHSYLRDLYAGLLADPAIAGITVGAHWDNIQLTDPLCFFHHSCLAGSDGYDWSYLDDAFKEANAANKTVQLTLTPGFDSPSWLTVKIPACDGLFSVKATARADCGTMTFTAFPQEQRSDSTVLPLPWNPIYKIAWWDFLSRVNARYSSNAAFVAIAVAGPMGASTEWILPTTSNETSLQAGGLAADQTWAALLKHSFPNTAGYQNTDQVFIDEWKHAIDAYEKIFSGITLFVSPDAGNYFPEFSQKITPHADNTLFNQDCANVQQEVMSCEAKTEILSYFLTVAGPNAKSTQVGGMTASSQVVPGNIGIAGVKLLTAAGLQGGADFDHPVSDPKQIQGQGCPASNPHCTVTPEEAAYNVLTVFFYGTPAAAFYGGMLGSAPIQYLEVPYLDVQYAQANPCPPTASATLGKTSLQDLLNLSSRDLFQMAGQSISLPAPTCN